MTNLTNPLPPKSQLPHLPRVLLLDLDDTVLRFTCGQPDAWRYALETHTEAEHVDGHLAAVRRVGQEYWSNLERAHHGRQNLERARCDIARHALGPRGVGPELADTVGQTMTEAKEAAVRPFDGAIDTLRALRARGHRLGLLTNGCQVFQRRKLERFDLAQHFELILIEGELGFGKPDARVFQRALDHFDVAPHQTRMIGDNVEADIDGAQALGIPGIWNNCNRLDSAGDVVPHYEIATLSDLNPAT